MSASPSRRAEALPGFVPARVDQVEVGAPLVSLPVADPTTGKEYRRSYCVVRLHGAPLGVLDVELPRSGLDAEELAGLVEERLGTEIDAHLEADELDRRPLTAAGLAGSDSPRCAAERSLLASRAPMVSIVICTRDRPASVRETLRSILASSYPSNRFEVIVVDNASVSPGAVISAVAFDDEAFTVRVVREPMAGLSRARNAGVRDARGEIVVFADDDLEVDPDWLATLVGPFLVDPEVGATSGMTLPMALDTVVEQWTEGFGMRPDQYQRRVLDLKHPPEDRPLFPFTVGDLGAGRNMAFRRDLLVELGGFDPALGPGTLAHDGDDIEALLRVVLSGRRLVHDPAAIVWHAHPRDLAELEQRVWGYGIGLTACLTRAVRDHPGLLTDLIRKLPRALAFAVSPRSAKNVGRQPGYPQRLARRELAGMAYGPLAYLRSRRDQRRLEREADARVACAC